MSSRAQKTVGLIIVTLVVLILVGAIHKTANSPSPPAVSHTQPSPGVPHTADIPIITNGGDHHHKTRASRGQVDRQDRYFSTGEGKREIARLRSVNPAYQHLPYRTDQVHIDIADVTSDGRIVLSVLPLGMNVNPRHAYAAFLRYFHDSGRGYLPRYERYLP